MPNLKKVEGERGLYINPDSGSYFVRVQNPKDTFISLGTKRKGDALKRMDARRAAKAAAKMGIALDPDEPARQVTVSEVVSRYEMDGYPDRKGNPRADTPHRRSEKDACALLLRFFKDDGLVDGLNQNVLDHYHD